MLKPLYGKGSDYVIIHILFNISTRLAAQPSPPQAEAEQQQQHSAAGKADNDGKFFEPSEAAAL